MLGDQHKKKQFYTIILLRLCISEKIIFMICPHVRNYSMTWQSYLQEYKLCACAWLVLCVADRDLWCCMTNDGRVVREQCCVGGSAWGVPYGFWCVCVCVCPCRWRSVWIWSSRWHTALTRSWLPACRVSRALMWRRDLSSHLLWVSVSIRHWHLMQMWTWCHLIVHNVLQTLYWCYFFPLLSEKTTTHNPGTVYGRGGCSVGRWLSPGVSQYS